MATPTLLIVADDGPVRRRLRDHLDREGYSVIESGVDGDGLHELAADVDLVLLDAAVTSTVGALVPWSATALGAKTLVLTRPFDLHDVAMSVEQALDQHRGRADAGELRTTVVRDCGIDAIIGSSPGVRRVKALLKRVAASPASTVLLTGETGTGKDLAARVIHANSDRAGRPFVNVTCSAMPEHLLESELFGHERGAFTDARQQKRGLLETADGGTAFFDEVDDLAPALQTKLLRFLEEKTFKRVGGLADLHVDVRVVAASNRDLRAQVAAGRCREDLFYRLQVVSVALPPLRDRYGDIPLLVDYYVGRFNAEFGTHVKGVTAEALALLDAHQWSGNVRELRHALERAVLLGDSDWLTPDDFADLTPQPVLPAGSFRLPPEGVSLREVEKQLVTQALERSGGNQTRAAHLLGINRDQVRYRILKFGLMSLVTPDTPVAG